MGKVRIIVDILMTLLFILVMGYHLTGTFLHELAGALLGILFIVHNLLNRKWYQSIFKGKYSLQRSLHLFVNAALIIAFAAATISGIMLSQFVFNFLNFQSTMFARRLHMLSTSWSYVLMAVHLGFHYMMIIVKIKQLDKMVKNILFILTILLGIYGCYVFISSEFYNQLFMLVDFVFLDYNQSFFVFFIRQIALMITFVWIGYFIKVVK